MYQLKILSCPRPDNDLSPCRHKAIIWINDGILSIGLLETNLSEILITILHIFIHENAFQNVVCEITATLSQPQCVKLWKEERVQIKAN